MLSAILVAVLLVLGTTLIHYEILRVTSARLCQLPIPPRFRIVAVVLAVFVGHTLEVCLYGLAYWGLAPALGDIRIGIGDTNASNLEDFVYFSLATYTTLGFGDLIPTGHLRLLAAIESLNGLVLVAWSASFTYLVMERYWPLHAPNLGQAPQAENTPR